MWQNFFYLVADSSLIKPPKPWKDKDLPCVTHEQFIQEGDWERSGASSIGEVNWKYTDQEDGQYSTMGFFKARKNFVLDLMTAKELANKCFSEPCFKENVAKI